MKRIFETPLPLRRSPDQDRETPTRLPEIVVGTGRVGLAAATDLALHNIPVVLLDENDRVSSGSRAICFAKRPLEILDRLVCGQPIVKGGYSGTLARCSSATEKSTNSTWCRKLATSARPLVNSGRLSVPCTCDLSPA